MPPNGHPWVSRAMPSAAAEDVSAAPALAAKLLCWAEATYWSALTAETRSAFCALQVVKSAVKL